MTISYSDQSPLTCPTCGHAFEAPIWLLVDAAERPDLVAALREGRLNVTACPECGRAEDAGAPLLYHDAAARRVVFVAPEGAREYEQREMLRELHTLLMSSIPEEQQRAYLGDVQITMGLYGLRSILEKDARRARSRPAAPAAAPPAAPVPAERALPEEPQPAELPPLLLGVHELLTANSEREIEGVLARFPALLAPDADGVLAQLADTAANQREPDVAQALGEARRTLRRLRGAGTDAGPAAEGAAPAADPGDGAVEVETARRAVSTDAPAGIAPDAFAALLRARSEAELLEVARAHPALLDADADAALGQQIDAALDLGDERSAQALEDRREALAALRRGMAGGALETAIQALFAAGDPDAMAAVIDEHPALLTDEAQRALWQLASDARAGGDEESAAAAVEYRALLREIRAGLNGA
jgi:hypothetical protein